MFAPRLSGLWIGSPSGIRRVGYKSFGVFFLAAHAKWKVELC